MLSFIPENERSELSELLVIAFYPSWSDDVGAKLAIRRKAIGWIRSYRKGGSFQHSAAINLVLDCVLTHSWLKKEVRNYSVGIADKKSSSSVVDQSRVDLLRLTDQIYQFATGDEGLCSLKMLRY
ncbi:hypothetical protein [Pseudomonas syringae]|uniref:hypothetical protein n=1 Tax=Pseudomonas syringae TaxID=317 RepID=UPI000E32A7E6|nr:hypothetical protein [Pseudomonas syringae]